MKVTLAVTADYANVSREGKLNIVGIFTELTPPSFPFTVPQMFIVVTLEPDIDDEPQEHRLRISVVDPSEGEVIATPEGVVPPIARDPSGKRVGVTQIAGLSNVTFTDAGNYAFVITLDKSILERVILHVGQSVEGGN